MTQPTENDLARARTYLSGETYEPGAAPWSSDEKWIARAFVRERERIVEAMRENAEKLKHANFHLLTPAGAVENAADAIESGEL